MILQFTDVLVRNEGRPMIAKVSATASAIKLGTHACWILGRLSWSYWSIAVMQLRVTRLLFVYRERAWHGIRNMHTRVWFADL
jgi:hypothetical protein